MPATMLSLDFIQPRHQSVTGARLKHDKTSTGTLLQESLTPLKERCRGFFTCKEPASFAARSLSSFFPLPYKDRVSEDV